MICFPVFERIEITGFGLYPGTKKSEGLKADLKPGLTLILGANGLGKTTLVTILYRLLTGPYDVPALSSSSDLGNAKLQATKLRRPSLRIFADRVTDGASGAYARLEFSLGTDDLIVERRLDDLSLAEFVINGEEQKLDEVNVFQDRIAELAGVWSFGDWILLLRNMIFYFEDRRALVWDTSAQKQLFRCLFLPSETAKKWTEDERAILELDSRMRNLRASVFSEERDLSKVAEKVKKSKNVKQELESLESLQAADENKRDELDQQFIDLDPRLKRAQLRLLRAQQERESRYREYERAKLKAVESRFPQHSESAKYILEQLFAESECLVCGNHSPSAAALLEKRIAENDCVVCGTDLSNSLAAVPTTKVADRRVARAHKKLDEIEPELKEASIELEESRLEINQLKLELASIDAEMAERSERIDSLIERLPPEEKEIHKQRAELATMRARVATMTDQLESDRKLFAKFVEQQNREMVGFSSSITEAFAKYAEGFLLETVSLVWSPQRSRVGQGGELIEFPAFELDMSGTDFPTPVRRSGPEQVSESQREFIDLAFRMALMEVASESEPSSLVIDAPESSLDAIFVSRAATVLARFGTSDAGNRLAVTSNLVEGELIPELLKKSAPPGERLSRIIDLFEIAEPTAAIREQKSEYSKILKKLYNKVEPPKRRPRRVSNKRATKK